MGRLGRWVFCAVLVLITTLACHRSFLAPFVFDGQAAIQENPTIRRLPDLKAVLTPPAAGSPVTGRPIVNLSFAVNYAFGSLDVRGYHAVNLMIHILAGLTMFGIVGRTLGGSWPEVAAGQVAQGSLDRWLFAAAAALIWTVHPLQTESVTYVAQRAESLMGFLYLQTLYCFVRSTQSSRPWVWLTLSVAACLGGWGRRKSQSRRL